MESPNQLDLTVLSKAINSLSVALNEYKKDTSNEFVRDSCIQRFEYCYDLSAKFIKRYLALTSENPTEIKELSFQNLIRTAYGKGLLKNSWDEWWQYRDNRNVTSHGYDENKAIKVVTELPPFYQEMQYLLNSLQERNDF
ncbi:nucleotidyltransferase substrate binding protein [Thiomicrorhabdus sp. 6S2-11]|uniref:Nucleotidyltransferase substrate binding protein n=1 Tax=Thiomicrorhabdus marina TaxID=2818442 RepID=A0ABS3Q2E9_9GAMM|nr:HI0074 family nucleotidyltransferase substrate-binding subunit [Thiomicrorhabdus marina]MBO1926482.1 nucleotidyltransferase substrate binding protein [Thiomicrorhabdus marina]